MLGGCFSRSSQDTGMERDDQPHTRHSPGPFHVSGSWGFSPGSGFSGSLGLSGASLDSAAGGGRQQVMSREFQRQHSTGAATTGPVTPRVGTGTERGFTPPCPKLPTLWEHLIPLTKPLHPKNLPKPPHVTPRATPRQRAQPRSPHGLYLAAYS